MPWTQTDFVNPQNLNTKSGLVIDIRDDEFGATPDKRIARRRFRPRLKKLRA